MDDDDAVVIALDWCLRDIARLAGQLGDPDWAWDRWWWYFAGYLRVEPLRPEDLDVVLLNVSRRVRGELQAAL